jgi:hypothetical protein
MIAPVADKAIRSGRLGHFHRLRPCTGVALACTGEFEKVDELTLVTLFPHSIGKG